jgi:hypothetical protein
MPTKFLSENLKGRYLSSDPGWQIMDKVCLSGLDSVIGCCECGNELLGSTRNGKLLEYRYDY